MDFKLEWFTATAPSPNSADSHTVSHPSVELTVPGEFKILSGGAIDNYTGYGNILTASYPAKADGDLALDHVPRKWIAAGKDHQVSDPSSITAWVIALYDPDDVWDVQFFQGTPDSGKHALTAWAWFPIGGYVLTGGGANVTYTGAGNLLTASFPSDDPSHQGAWEARAKDHDVEDLSESLTAYIIGIRSRDGILRLTPVVGPPVNGAVAEHPFVLAPFRSTRG